MNLEGFSYVDKFRDLKDQITDINQRVTTLQQEVAELRDQSLRSQLPEETKQALDKVFSEHSDL
jgi:predicted nuclease with TOPRIM domain